MKLYLDDDSASALLCRLLRNAGHDVELPSDAGLTGEDDSVHLAHAIRADRACLSHNHRDFANLHNLLMIGQGHHAGILIVRKDNNPRRDMDEAGIVRALARLMAAGMSFADHLHILNHWR